MHTRADPEIYQIQPQNQAKETWKKCPPKWFKLPWGCECLSGHVCLSTRAVLFSLLINALLVSLLSVFVAVLFCKAERPRPLSLTTGLVIRIWCSDCCNLSSVSNWGPKLHFKQLRAKATQDEYHHHSGVSSAYAWVILTFNLKGSDHCLTICHGKSLRWPHLYISCTKQQWGISSESSDCV